MKKILCVIFVLSFGVVFAQRKPKIKGNRNTTEVLEPLPAFHTIELRDDLQINLDESSSESYSVVGDDNLIDVLRFRVADSTLIISSFYKITGKKQLDITINYRQLKSLIVRDGSVVTNQRIQADQFSILSVGTARIELSANAAVVDLSLEENSKGNFNLEADSLSLSLKDKANVELYGVTQRHKLSMEGNTTANLEGTSDNLNINLKGSPNLRAQKLESAVIRLETGDTAVSRIYGYRELELLASGSSRTYLYGNPGITMTVFEDSAELHKEQE